MITKMRQATLVILAIAALVALGAFATACGDTETTTTVPGSTATTTGDTTGTEASTATTAATTDSTSTEATSTASTMVTGGKTLDDYRAEIPDLEKAIEADPADLYSLESLAVAHYQLKEYEQAEAAYLKILAIQEDAFTRNNLGNVYRDWGKTEEAKAAYRQAIEEDPTLKYPYVNLSGVLQKEGDTAGAMEVLEEGAKYVTEEGKTSIEAAQEALTTTTR